MSFPKYKTSTAVISVIVMLQAVFVLHYVTLSFVEPEEMELPVQAVVELEENAEIEVEEFISRQDRSGARVWLQPLVFETLLDGTEKAVIWLETDKKIGLVEVRLQYRPEEVVVLDLEDTHEGIQIQFGEAERYLVNEVDLEKGLIRLVVPFDDAMTGSLRLGTVYFRKKDPQRAVRFWFEYFPEGTGGSVVKDWESKENILEEPKEVRM